jgi:hypothetical protein
MEDWLSSPGLRPPKKDDTQAKLNDADEQIAMAHRHVDRGRLIIERQRAIVACHGGWASAADLLECFEITQHIFETDLANLLKRK